MEFRKAVQADLKDIMNIIKQAQQYLKKQGIDQWQNNYPNDDSILNDIHNGDSYVLLKDNMVVGTVAIIFTGEKTYDKIYKGQWLSNGKYATIHRIAVNQDYKGQGSSVIMLKNIEDLCRKENIHSIKVDTHEENLSMQRFLEKSGFKYCGIIYLEDGKERVAFEKLI